MTCRTFAADIFRLQTVWIQTNILQSRKANQLQQNNFSSKLNFLCLSLYQSLSLELTYKEINFSLVQYKVVLHQEKIRKHFTMI